MRRKRGVVRQSLICSTEPIGLSNSGLPIYPIMGAEGEGDEGGDDEGGEDGDDEDDEEDGEDDKSKDKKSKDKDELPKPKRRAPANETDAQKIKRLNAENKERRETAERLEREARERADKDKSELEVTKRDRTEFKTKYEQVSSELLAAKVENAFLKFREKTKDGDVTYEWQDPDLVLDILNSKYELELGDDGTVTGLAAAIKELAKTKPFLLANADDNDGTKSRKTQGPSGGASGARKKPAPDAARQQKLHATYAVLGQGVPIP